MSKAVAAKPWYRQGLALGPGGRDVYNFTSQLAVMLRAGINLRTAIEGIAEQAQNAKFKSMLQSVHRDVDAGRQFSEAIGRFPKTFGPLYVNMVRASEMSGGLSRMLDRIAQYQLQQIETVAMVRGAMVYPGVIGTLALGVTVFLLTFVLPSFMSIFAGKEAVLPVPTKALLWVSGALTNYWYLILALLVVGGYGLFVGLKTARGRVILDAAKLKVPLFKKMFRALYVSRSLHTLGQLLNAGVPMLDALGITAQVAGNTQYRDLWTRVQSSVREGKKLSQPLAKDKLLPRSVVQMVGAGEESGKLGEVLDEVSAFYARELKAVIKTTTALIEPLMIVVMGGLVGFIAMSIILPIFKMSQLVG